MGMEYYGNKTWNNATDNKDKSVVPLREESLQKILPVLEQSGLNFYAYVKDGTAALAVNSADTEKLKRVLGDQGKALQFQKSAKPYTPPQKNIIGNVAYRYIPDKQYISLDRDTALKMAQQLEQANISYSGVIYASGKATLTVGGADLARAEAIKQSVLDLRRQFMSEKKAEQIIGNTAYREIQNRRVLFTDVSPKQYEEMKDYLDSHCKYSGLIRNGKVMFTVDESDKALFAQAVNTALDMQDTIAEMQKSGYSAEQIESVKALIERAAEKEDTFFITNNLDPRFTPEQFEKLKALMALALEETDMAIFDKDSSRNKVYNLKKEFTHLAGLADVYALHSYSDEQKAVIADIYSETFPVSLFEVVDETYTPDEMRELADIIEHFTGYDDVQSFLDNHENRLQITPENMEIYKALKEHKPVYLHKENGGDGYEFHNERIEYYAGYGFAVLGDTDRDSDLVHQHFYTRNAEEVVIDFIQSGELAKDGYVIDGLTAPEMAEQSAEITPETPELTDMEKAFQNFDLVPFLAKNPVAWDEIESMGYRIFDPAYNEKFAPSEKSSFGNHLPEKTLYELAKRFHNGEDIRAELAKGLLGKQSSFRTDNWNEFSVTHGEDSLTAAFGNVTRELTYTEIGQAMLDLIQKEHDEIVHDSTIQTILDDVKGIDTETAEKVLTAFDSNIQHGWDIENDPAKINRIKRAIFDVLGDDEKTEAAFAAVAWCKYDVKLAPEKKESSIHFGLLGYSITAYDVSRTDPETNDYPTVAHITPEGAITLYDKTLSEDDMKAITAQAQSAREQFLIEWNKLTPIQQYQRLYNNADMTTMSNISKEKSLSMEEKIAKYMPFVFFKEGERPEPEQEQHKGTYQIYQLPSGEQYHGIRFESLETLTKEGVSLNISDYDLVYEGELPDFKGNATLESLFTKFNTDHPADFKGHSLSVSDVIVVTVDNQQTAYYCDSTGFAELPDFFKEKEITQEQTGLKVDDLSVGDVIRYQGKRYEVEKLDERHIDLKDLDSPDFGGVLLSTNEVFSYQGWREDMERKGFEILSKAAPEEKEEPVKLREIVIDLNPQNTVRFDREEPETVSSLDKAKNLINDFCVEEYSTEADFSDMSHVDIAYTTDEETMLPILVYADLESFRIVKEYDGNEAVAESYGSLDEMLPALESLDFGDLVYLADEEKGVTERTNEAVTDDAPSDTSAAVDEDTPLFADEAVMEQIEADSNAGGFGFSPFSNDNQGEQLTLFGDSEPLVSKPPKKTSAPKKEQYETGLFVGNVNRFTALRDDLMRGTGFQDGKFTVLDYYKEHKPTNKEFADFLKQHYGVGGHSGDGEISFVDHDSQGIVFSLETGEKFKFTWSDVAEMLSAMIGKGEYITPHDIEEHQNHAKYVVEHTNPDTELNYEQITLARAKSVLAEYGIEAAYKGDTEQTASEQETAKKAVTADNIEVGDAFLYKGKEYTVTEMQGVYPDDVGVTRTDSDSRGTQFAVTENIDRHKLIHEGEYLGNPDKGIEPLVQAENSVIPPAVSEKPKLNVGTDPARFTALSDEAQAFMSDYPPIPIPEMSPWGEVQECTIIAKGVFEVSTAGHGGIMIHEGLAEQILSDEALQIGFTEDGFRCYEEDSDAQIPLRELLDKGIMDRDEYFSDKYHSTYAEKGEWFENALNSSIASAHPDYWQAHENAVGNAEQAVQTEQFDNFKITDEALGEGGQKSKFRANINAIRTLKQIEAENRPATPEEQEILSRYVGWGGLAPAFEENNSAWAAEHKELTELLTDEEYRSARASTLDAFYTSPVVIDGIYEALHHFGFEGGNVLEPSCGIGNFFGRMDEETRRDSHLYGVEIDSLSGRIAQLLYPSAEITISGFEKNEFQNGSFDVVLGNVPFGTLGFKDEKHNTTQLHDYFFAESLDKVKSGGILALVTSAGTLDKQNEATRAMLAQQADLIGAVRLPSTAFKGNANTEVTTDIIFLQKRSEPPAELPDWVHIGQTEDGLPINKYYEQHPDMVLGKVIEGNKLYSKANGTMVVPFEGTDLKALLHEAVGKLSAEISDERPRNVYAKAEQGEIPVPNNLRNYSFFEHEDKIYFKTADRVCAFRFDDTNKLHKRARAFIELRDTVRELLTAQELDRPDSEIKALQDKLNAVYDSFYKKFGLLHSRTNKKLFSEDISYNLALSLEKEIDKDKLVAKSDMFTKRTIRPPKPVGHVETAMEALTLSAAEKACVDFDYMSALTGMTENELKKELEGEIFKVPHTVNTYQTKSEYLSGDIRKKLKAAQEAAEYDSDFNINVTALKGAMPTPLKAGDIDVKIGATWIDPKIYQQFLYEMLQTPEEYREGAKWTPFRKSNPIKLSYSPSTGTFHIDLKRQDMSVNATQTFGTRKMNAYEIMEQLLNLKEPKIYKSVEVTDQYGNPTEKRVIDQEATRVVQKKADKIRSEFKKWIFKDPQRREMLVDRYNELFNSVRPREYDGSALSFPLMNSDIHLHEHQKNAVAHALFGGNTLFAHSVGAGKTFEMIATAMEAKRLGLCTKSLFAVPNHLTEQIGSDFRKLYPSANILVATKNDFKKENRQQLFAKIATGNFDAVIIGHSQLGMIPISKERQIMQVQEQIADILQGIEELKKQEGTKFQVKQMERTRKNLQKQLEKLEKQQDDTITFEQLGVDKLFVDEAHECTTRL